MIAEGAVAEVSCASICALRKGHASIDSRPRLRRDVADRDDITDGVSYVNRPRDNPRA